MHKSTILLKGTLSRSIDVLCNAQKRTSTWEFCKCNSSRECPSENSTCIYRETIEIVQLC